MATEENAKRPKDCVIWVELDGIRRFEPCADETGAEKFRADLLKSDRQFGMAPLLTEWRPH